MIPIISLPLTRSPLSRGTLSRLPILVHPLILLFSLPLLLLNRCLLGCLHLGQVDLLKHLIFVILAVVVLNLDDASSSSISIDTVSRLDVWKE